MTKAQKAALRFAYDLLRGRYNNQLATLAGVRMIVASDAIAAGKPAEIKNIGVWLEPDKSTDHDYLNEAVFAALVVRGFMECRSFPPNKLWLYRITPEGCTAIGKLYPGSSHITQQIPRKFRQRQSRDPHHPLTLPPDHRDPHRFRRSNDWRKQ
jgi:hypothetical protein